ncbi:MAG: YHS domain-containing protein [bacterium]|nr:YHS domain-containing protein [bacterium]
MCLMEASSDLFKTDYRGKSYYFCSDHCREQFVANPGKYVD